MTDGISFVISNGALITCSAILGAIAHRIAGGSGQKGKSVDRDTCEKAHLKNDDQHKEFYNRLEALEISRAETRQVLAGIEKHLASIDAHLQRVLGL